MGSCDLFPVIISLCGERKVISTELMPAQIIYFQCFTGHEISPLSQLKNSSYNLALNGLGLYAAEAALLVAL